MTDSTTLSKPHQWLRRYRAYFFWFLLLSIYLYWTLLPEFIFVNGSGTRVEQLKVTIPGDDKIWRNIEHGNSKAFRYQPARVQGQYEVAIILADGRLVRGNFKQIEPWDFGHKAIFELSPDLNLRADFSYSLFGSQ